MNEGNELKQEGMSLALENTDPTWHSNFLKVGVDLAETGAEFTVMDIINIVDMPKKGSPSAVGAAMGSLVRSLKLQRVGYVSSKRPSCHAAIVAKWKKL